MPVAPKTAYANLLLNEYLLNLWYQAREPGVLDIRLGQISLVKM